MQVSDPRQWGSTVRMLTQCVGTVAHPAGIYVYVYKYILLRISESGLMNASTHPGPQTVISLNACSD